MKVKQAGSKWVIGGSFIAAVFATSCCILPLVFFSVGISGAWISNITALAPYQPVFIGLSLLLIGGGFYLLHIRRRQNCDDGTCRNPVNSRMAYLLLFLSLFLVMTALTFPWVVKFFLD
ncbi:hypothetical protein MNBD_ALPHA03-910 [hydrothermal vent metagenome]|uniref:Mercuric transport protein, MerT n=1 Tax=hydrothermal vent metagenome TaxID=652676 RepID=A0A3B1AR30_9ZZZZ